MVHQTRKGHNKRSYYRRTQSTENFNRPDVGEWGSCMHLRSKSIFAKNHLSSFELISSTWHIHQTYQIVFLWGYFKDKQGQKNFIIRSEKVWIFVSAFQWVEQDFRYLFHYSINNKDLLIQYFLLISTWLHDSRLYIFSTIHKI